MLGLRSIKLETCVFLNLIILANIISLSNSQNVLCPDVLKKFFNESDSNSCSRAKCLTDLTNQKDCPEGTFFMPHLTLCNCCPGCAKFISAEPLGADTLKIRPICTEAGVKEPEYEDCNDLICPVIMNECPPGFECGKDGNDRTTCIQRTHLTICNPEDPKDESLCPVHSPPTDPKVECPYKKFLYMYGEYHWDPVCDEDGYAAKQCKGISGTYDGECFCMSREGKRVFGRQWWAEAESQTCACSRKVSDLRSKNGGQNIATLHCTSDGNYEPVQCDIETGTCWCVEPKTGRMTGAILPRNQWKLLPCYNTNLTHPETTDNYLRFCDSEMAAKLKLQKEGEIHGTVVQMSAVSCDYDGSFAPVQNDGTTYTCTHKNGLRILDFFKIGNNEDIDCNCARDQIYYEAAGREFPFYGKCQGQTGNYNEVYDFGAMSSCIDRDGFAYGSKEVPSTHVCCLLNQCSTMMQAECAEKNYVPCKTLSYNI